MNTIRPQSAHTKFRTSTASRGVDIHSYCCRIFALPTSATNCGEITSTMGLYFLFKVSCAVCTREPRSKRKTANMAHPHTAPHSVPDQMWTQRQGMHAAVLSPPRALLDFLLHDAAASCHTARGSTAPRQHTTLTRTHYSCCSHKCRSHISENV